MKGLKILSLILVFTLMLCPLLAYAQNGTEPISSPEYSLPILSQEDGFNCKSVILMEASTGAVLYEQNPDEALPPASVTKVMTLLLVMEAIESGRVSFDDMVSTSERAASMGGSQIYLEVGEQMSLEDMLKSVIIASANDAACALAEHVSGSEQAFVEQMNKRAAELGMTNTRFENTNGLDDTAKEHLTSARDIAIMSRELIKHKKILEYSSIWMDTVRDGAFGLTNTNRLVRFYRGCTGLKTGSTDKAGFCISATAERDGLSLICVVMGAPTRDERNNIATTLLDRGFASYSLYSSDGGRVENIEILGASVKTVQGEVSPFSALCEKGSAGRVESEIKINDGLCAPLGAGDVIGYVRYTLDGKEIGRVDIKCVTDAPRIDYFTLLWRAVARYFLK